MKKWEDFEIECTDYLNETFGQYAEFYHQGGADSTVSDILVSTKSNKKFYIEAKHSPAQCGQFVLLPNIQSKTFEYSSLNTSPINEYVLKIMEHMNNQFEEFREAGTAGKEIIMDNGEKTFSNWIVQNYRHKGTNYFITNDYVIIPIEQFSSCFKTTAKYRIKRSGSSSVGKSLAVYFSNVFSNNEAHNYNIICTRIYNDKLFVQSERELHNKRFIYKENEFMFSKRDSEYEIRKLSNTNNANVIFSITLKEPAKGLSISEFENVLK